MNLQKESFKTIQKVKLKIENRKSEYRILLHQTSKYSVKELNEEYFKHLKKQT